MLLTILNYTLKNGYNDKFHVVCILPIIEKQDAWKRSLVELRLRSWVLGSLNHREALGLGAEEERLLEPYHQDRMQRERGNPSFF